MVQVLLESICAALATLVALPGIVFAALEPTPPPLREAEIKTGVTVYANDSAAVDASNLSQGFLIVSYTGGKDVRIKVRITREDSETYTYNLNNRGEPEVFPLTDGNGLYTIKVYENTVDSKYATVYTETLAVELENEFIPFLSSNQYVNFTNDSATVAQGLEITKGIDGDLDKVAAVFDWVVDNFGYDYDKASAVQSGSLSGYLPVVDEVLDARKGICFDYAAVMAAMLRSQGIPCKLVVGWAGEIYHAWINVYVDGEGWVDQVIYFNGENWTMMDPTFTSTGNRSEHIMEYVTNSGNYLEKYVY